MSHLPTTKALCRPLLFSLDWSSDLPRPTACRGSDTVPGLGFHFKKPWRLLHFCPGGSQLKVPLTWACHAVRSPIHPTEKSRGGRPRSRLLPAEHPAKSQHQPAFHAVTWPCNGSSSPVRPSGHPA